MNEKNNLAERMKMKNNSDDFFSTPNFFQPRHHFLPRLFRVSHSEDQSSMMRMKRRQKEKQTKGRKEGKKNNELKKNGEIETKRQKKEKGKNINRFGRSIAYCKQNGRKRKTYKIKEKKVTKRRRRKKEKSLAREFKRDRE